ASAVCPGPAPLPVEDMFLVPQVVYVPYTPYPHGLARAPRLITVTPTGGAGPFIAYPTTGGGDTLLPGTAGGSGLPGPRTRCRPCRPGCPGPHARPGAPGRSRPPGCCADRGHHEGQRRCDPSSGRCAASEPGLGEHPECGQVIRRRASEQT